MKNLNKMESNLARGGLKGGPVKAVLTLFCFSLFAYPIIGNANSLRESRESIILQTIGQFDYHVGTYLKNDFGQNRLPGGVLNDTAAGQSIPIIDKMRNPAVEKWQTAEPLDYRTINKLYNPFCLTEVSFEDIRSRNLVARRDALSNEIEANLQIFGTYETPTFASLVESASVLRNNLNTLSNSIALIPVVNEQIANLLAYVLKVENTHLNFLNLISSNLSNSNSLNESIQSLYVLQGTVIDATEKEILNQVITLMTSLSKLPTEVYDGIKSTQMNSEALAITSQINSYKIMVTKWQSDVQASYNKTSISLTKIEADIAATRSIMSQATEVVDRDTAAIKNLETEAESLAISNFQKIDSRVNEVIGLWHQYNTDNSDRPPRRLWLFVSQGGFISKIEAPGSGRAGMHASMERPGCYDTNE